MNELLVYRNQMGNRNSSGQVKRKRRHLLVASEGEQRLSGRSSNHSVLWGLKDELLNVIGACYSGRY
ncbi:hypothetical protein N9A58_09235 [Opitutales bacterium]|nr:hypothetical protein [Opitutales bacterium]